MSKLTPGTGKGGLPLHLVFMRGEWLDSSSLYSRSHGTNHFAVKLNVVDRKNKYSDFCTTNNLLRNML